VRLHSDRHRRAPLTPTHTTAHHIVTGTPAPNGTGPSNDDDDGGEEEEEEEYDDSVDIYGRVPPKEPRHSLACAACGRPVGVGRYAPHLDKCLGKGKAGRSGGSQRGKQNQSQSQSQQSPAVGGGGGGNGGGKGGGAGSSSNNKASGGAAAAGGGGGGGTAAGGTGSTPTKAKAPRKKKDQNKHPLLPSYAFPDEAPTAIAAARLSGAGAPPIVFRLKLEKGGG
jgi:hypothetical protein